ncbi:MAG: tyrosine-type recombinase/integrase [Eubacteriales bacterium]|nr:tyrosine-type recombinase/integrase [Eubacteriales bacterium]
MKRSLTSSIGPQIERFLEFKRSQGFKYDTAEYYLSNLDYYWAANGYDNNFSKEHINGWSIRGDHENPDTHNFRSSYLREFGRFLQSQGYRDAYIIPTGLSKRGPKYMPHLLSEDEIEKFFGTCDRITPQKENPGKHLVLPAYFRFLYCCGVRTSEARLLKIDDVNLVQGYADIINTKGGKCRRLFLSNELIELLDEFDSKISIYYPGRTYFFPCHDNDPYSSQAISRAFNKIWSDAGLPAECNPKPRAYDFRHHFAFANINRWVENGINVNGMLPYLMNYMGHASIESTFYYIHLIPEFFGIYSEKTKALESMLPEVG